MRWKMSILFIMLEILFMVTTVRSRRAFLEIILYEMNENDGRYTMQKIGITGEFSNAGTAGAAEGDIIQMHPHSLCDDVGNGDKYDYGWVGVVKLSYHGSEPCHLVEKARKAVGQGATAVIFDVSDHPDALRQVDENSYSILNQPIVLVKGMDATELMKVINGEQIARAVIKRGQPDQDSVEGKFTDPALLMTGILIIFVILAVAISKVKCRKRQQQASLHNWTVQHSKTKKHRKNGRFYHAVPQESKEWKKTCGTSECSSAMLCAICLDSFQDGEDLRVLECLHEFHIKCIDVWLKQKRACPLCNRSFSNLTANAQSGQQGAAANIQNATDNLSSAWHQSETQLVHASLIDESQNSTTYGSTLQRSENDTHHHRSFISDSTNQSSRTINDSVTSDFDHNTGSDADGLYHETCHECNSCDTSWNGGTSDHKDSVMISHRKRNQNRGLSCRRTKNELTKSTIEFSAAERTKLRAAHYATNNYLHRKGNEMMKDKNAYADGMCDENCVCRINGASDTSMLALRGSPPFFERDPDFLSSSSTFFDTSKFVEYSSDQPRVDTSEYCNQLPRRCPTPCIEYSSSDGASHLGWISYSTLEDVLGAIDSSHSGFSS